MKRFINSASYYAWYLLVLLLPISSMPIVAKILGSSSVASPSIIFLGILVIIWFIPKLFSGIVFPKDVIPFLFFILCAIASTLLSWWLNIPPYKGIAIIKTNIQAVFTLAIGAGFYIISSTFVKDEAALRTTYKLINWSGLVMLAWGAMQAISWFGYNRYPAWMFDLQGIISSRVLYRQRINAFAIEPSWWAHMLNVVYIPIWLASTVKKISYHSFRIGILTFENILLVGSVIGLILTFSRVGLLGFLFMITFLLLGLHRPITGKIKSHIKKITKENNENAEKILVPLIIFTVYGLIISMGIVFLYRVDPRMAEMFDFSIGADNPFLRYFNSLRFGERAVYWLVGWEVFGQYPIMGVGLGNVGYYFPNNITPYGWTLIEVRKLIYRTSGLLNTKSLWMRLLAETGIVGFAAFVIWLLVLFFTFFEKVRSKNLTISSSALAGILIICALLAEGFSVDSFALPYVWVGLGLANRAIHIEPND